MNQLTRIVNRFDRKLLSKSLKQARLEKGLDPKDVSEFLGISVQQVLRYEDERITNQTPTVSMLARLCELYQISADDILYLDVVDCLQYPEEGVIYLYDIKDKKIKWYCPNVECRGENIEYEFDIKNGLICEHCNNFYNKLHESENDK